MLVRFGSGGFGSGYSAKLDADDGTYGAVKVAGRKVSLLSFAGAAHVCCPT